MDTQRGELMNRKQLIGQIEYAGYHNDTKMGVRLYCENRISFKSYNEAFRAGQQKRINGMKCNCQECKKLS
jgi:hypothetical protein